MRKNALAAGLAFALVLFAVWHGALRAEDRPPLKGLLDGNFILLDPPLPAPPEARVTDAAGAEAAVADFAGRVVLINFWATWCAPCIREMPSLDRLQAALGPEGLTVMAVSEDRGGLAKVAPFFAERGLDNLEVFLDPGGEFARFYSVAGLPTSFLIDRRGFVVGAIQGPLEWDGPDALGLIRFYLERRQDAAADG